MDLRKFLLVTLLWGMGSGLEHAKPYRPTVSQLDYGATFIVEGKVGNDAEIHSLIFGFNLSDFKKFAEKFWLSMDQVWTDAEGFAKFWHSGKENFKEGCIKSKLPCKRDIICNQKNPIWPSNPKFESTILNGMKSISNEVKGWKDDLVDLLEIFFIKICGHFANEQTCHNISRLAVRFASFIPLVFAKILALSKLGGAALLTGAVSAVGAKGSTYLMDKYLNKNKNFKREKDLLREKKENEIDITWPNYSFETWTLRGRMRNQPSPIDYNRGNGLILDKMKHLNDLSYYRKFEGLIDGCLRNGDHHAYIVNKEIKNKLMVYSELLLEGLRKDLSDLRKTRAKFLGLLNNLNSMVDSTVNGKFLPSSLPPGKLQIGLQGLEEALQGHKDLMRIRPQFVQKGAKTGLNLEIKKSGELVMHFYVFMPTVPSFSIVYTLRTFPIYEKNGQLIRLNPKIKTIAISPGSYNNQVTYRKVRCQS